MVILLVLQAIVALALIGVILLQKSEGGGLGLGGGASNNVFTARGAANFLTRLTAVLAGVFMLNCLIMSVIAGRQIRKQSSFLDVPVTRQEVPATSSPPSADDKK